MQSKDRQGKVVSGNEGQEKVLQVLYGTSVGRQTLKVLTNPVISKLGGRVLDSKISTPLISPFIEKNHIAMEQYEEEEYDSYNQFFSRRIKEGEREFSKEENFLCAPCDSKLTVERITKEGTFAVKNTIYTMDSLLRSEGLAKRYYGGTLLIFRLTVDDYHHYCYVDGGKKTRNYHIPGVFHTVNPVANDEYPIYTENTREFSILQSKNFGNILMMEVGALMVGKIVNHHEEKEVVRGMEKGFFEFGGSTVILAFQPGHVVMDEDIVQNTADGFETVVKMGEVIGRKRGH